MIPLDRFDKWPACLDDCARQYLRENEYQEYLSIAADERMNQLQALLERPIARFSVVNEVFFRARWAEVLAAAQAGKSPVVLEIASGDADMIPQLMARVVPGSRYITANMNKLLTARLRAKTRALPIEVVVIEEDAAAINRFLPDESVELIAFQHAVNDVLQAILCDQEGVDTIDTDWMAVLPKMISILQQVGQENSLEQRVRPAFLTLLNTLLKVLRKDGLLVMNHYMFQLDLDWGYPPGLWENLIPITREWLRPLPGCKEVFFEGFDPQWWLFYQKVR